MKLHSPSTNKITLENLNQSVSCRKILHGLMLNLISIFKFKSNGFNYILILTWLNYSIVYQN
jgi:hypothetical protein